MSDGAAVCPPACFYGDDFTGATAHLAGFHDAGLRSLLFFRTPGEELLRRHAGELDALGIAGVSRSLGPVALRDEVRPAFELFRRLGSRQIQYKVCSTFDSSPSAGSIGVAIELGREVFGNRPAPVVIGCPGFGRFTLFANLFARHGREIVRLDRHPSMANHPSTPMHEADLRLHLAEQTALPVGLVDIVAVRAGIEQTRAAWARAAGAGAVVFDTLDDSDLDTIARLLDALGRGDPVFSVAAQGLAQGLGRAMARDVSLRRRATPPPNDAERLLVLSGSAAALNAAQIRVAMNAGWDAIRPDVTELLQPGGIEIAACRIGESLRERFARGRHVVVYTATDAADPALEQVREQVRQQHLPSESVAAAIGALFARLLEFSVRHCGLRRFVLAGGDTASHAMRAIDAYALEIVADGRHGGRLCRLLALDPVIDGVEVMLKGGQVGAESTFVDAARRDGWIPTPH